MPDLSKKFRVLLTSDARAELEAIVRKKSLGAAKIRRATVLLMADEAHPRRRLPRLGNRGGSRALRTANRSHSAEVREDGTATDTAASDSL